MTDYNENKLYTDIYFKRDPDLLRDEIGVILEDGEPLWSDNNLYVGDGETEGGIIVGGNRSLKVEFSIINDYSIVNPSDMTLRLEGDDELYTDGNTSYRFYATDNEGNRRWFKISGEELVKNISTRRSIEEDQGYLQLVNDEPDSEEPDGIHFREHYYGTGKDLYDESVRGYFRLDEAPLSDANIQNPDRKITYDKRDLVTKIEYFVSDVLDKYKLYFYDEFERVDYSEFRRGDGTLIFGYEYIYDNEDRVKRVNLID